MAFRMLPEVKLDSLPIMAAQKYVKNFFMDMVLVVIMIELCVAQKGSEPSERRTAGLC